MKTVTLRRLRRESRLLDSAAAGEEIMVTRFGKPYVRISPSRAKSFLGAASHLGVEAPVTSEPVPPSEWKGLSPRRMSFQKVSPATLLIAPLSQQRRCSV